MNKCVWYVQRCTVGLCDVIDLVFHLEFGILLCIEYLLHFTLSDLGKML